MYFSKIHNKTSKNPKSPRNEFLNDHKIFILPVFCMKNGPVKYLIFLDDCKIFVS